jgi:NAD(P)-dependent dehydrogenase (short-subunit alcohol dehydrogenase family)
VKKEIVMLKVLVTGTSSGIGLATALALSRAGHEVYATVRNLEKGSQLREIAAAEKLPVSIFAMDVDSDTSTGAALADIRRQAGFIDALVNNAGIEWTGSVEELPLEVFRQVMETNYFGALRCIRALLPDMRRNRRGCIVNVTSVAGRLALSPLAPYVASKFALEALSESLAQEVKPFNIRVAILEPGVINTPMARRIEQPPGESLYPQSRRVAGMFAASLTAPTLPSVVADKIREILESGTWQLRHPVGPDAEPFLRWRAAMTDEDFVNWGALDDEAWYERVQQEFGIDARRKGHAAGS